MTTLGQMKSWIQQKPHNNSITRKDTRRCSDWQSIRQWGSSSQVPYIHVSSLLKVLHKDAGLTYLPLDSRTLLKSLRGKLLFEDMHPGKYRHIDLEASLVRFLVALQSKGIQIPSEIKLLFNSERWTSNEQKWL
jgi:hypothetical protein